MSRHRSDPLSLIAGIVLTGIGLVYLVGPPSGLGTQVRLVATLLLIGLGAGLLASVTRGEEPEPAEATLDPEPD